MCRIWSSRRWTCSRLVTIRSRCSAFIQKYENNKNFVFFLKKMSFILSFFFWFEQFFDFGVYFFKLISIFHKLLQLVLQAFRSGKCQIYSWVSQMDKNWKYLKILEMKLSQAQIEHFFILFIFHFPEMVHQVGIQFLIPRQNTTKWSYHLQFVRKLATLFCQILTLDRERMR